MPCLEFRRVLFRSEEHTSELRHTLISYAVFCLKKKKTFDVGRTAHVRESRLFRVDGRDIRVKVATLPDGTRRAKPEFDDLRRVAEETSRPVAEIRSEVMRALSSLDADITAESGR